MLSELLRVVVVGYGSIGTRHARLLQELGCNVAVVSRRTVDVPVVFNNIGTAIELYQPDYVIIANETALHRESLAQLAVLGYKGSVLIEKPVFDYSQPIPCNDCVNIWVAYNLRFHPIIARLKNLLKNEEILSVHSYVGQYLPDWRPNTDYRQCYSACAELGGGVLLDLSHDLDYLSWILGSWINVVAFGGHYSDLEITSDDLFTLLINFERCSVVSMQLNYLDRRGRRQLIINTSRHTFEADLQRNILIIDKKEEIFTLQQRDDTYKAMHTAILTNDSESICSVEQALLTLRLIDAARISSKTNQWVSK